MNAEGIHILREYDRIVQGETSGWQGETFFLAAQSFQALVALIERETETHDQSNLNPVATFSHERGRPALRLQQWVGVLRLPDGTVLEVLPKTHERGDDAQACRDVLLQMLAVTDERFREALPTLSR
ncbi:hypothetical protein GCM10017783_19000 [Deinococcus piscis]|uniref:Uncharacterized protein n=1 Tax=Deinococcus piscis TaxID=394230 RepID=A0ABQ3K9Y4_9DEIO|nr:hypothetical protein [Deinococcus piscis]GHG06641.1 hypothetical protein GCM10017783_19000 [Deinococcus piscis]